MKLMRVAVVVVLVLGITSMGAAQVTEDFEDGDIQGWTGDTGSFTAQQGTVLSGSYSGELNAQDAFKEVIYGFTGEKYNASFEAQLDTQTGDSGDQYRIQLFSSTNTELHTIRFRHDGDFTVNNVDTGFDWNGNTLYNVEISPDYSNNESEIFVNDQSVGTYSFGSTQTSDIAEIAVTNSDFSSGSTVNAYIDDIFFRKLNTPPFFDSTSINPDPPLIGDPISYTANASDSDGTVSNLELTVFKDGLQVYQNSVSSSSNTWSDVYTPQSSGDLNARFVATDDAGASTTEWLNRTVTNQPPVFEDTNVIPDPVVIGNNVGYNATVTDPDQSVDYTNLTVTYGTQTVADQLQRTGNNPVWNDVHNITSANKWLNATFTVYDTAGESTTTELNRYVEDTRPSFQINDPENITYQIPDIPYQVDFNDDGDNNPNEEAYCEAYNDGNLVRNASVTEGGGGETFSGTIQDVPAGSHTFQIECTETSMLGLATLTTTKSVQYSNVNGPPQIQSFTANPATNWQKGELIDFSYEIVDGFDNITYVNLTAKRDGTEIASREFNYNNASVTDTLQGFFEVNQIGDYSVYLTAQDEQGQVSSEWINQSVPDEYPPTSTLNVTGTRYDENIAVKLSASDEESMIENVSYQINAGGYTTDQGNSTSFTLNGFGDYIIDFYSWDTAGNKEEVKTETITLETFEADFFYSPEKPSTGQQVEFNAGSTQGNITLYEWDFQSDGTYDATGEVVNHVFNDPGFKDVTLRVTNAEGDTDTHTETIEVLFESENKSLIESCPDEPFCRNNGTNPEIVGGSFTAEDDPITFTYEVNATGADGEYDFFSFYNSTSARLDRTIYSDILGVTIASNETNIPPTADFSVSLDELSVSTDASASDDPDGTITEYRWDWTDDGTFEDTGLTASHTYPSGGEYTIRLEVEDNNGSVSTATKSISVSEDTQDGGGGGGTEPPEDDPGDEVSVDGTNATFFAPRSTARYGGSAIVVREGTSETFEFGGEEVQIEVTEVENQRRAEIVVNGVTREVSETETFALNSSTGVITFTENIYTMDVVKTETKSYATFTFDGSGPVDVPLIFSYQANSSADIEVQYAPTGPDSQWQTAETINTDGAVNYTTRVVRQQLDTGIYQRRLVLNSSGNSTMTEPVGFYIGQVPSIQITNPTKGQTFRRPRTGSYELPLDYRLHAFGTNNISTESVGQYYVGEDGKKYAEVTKFSVETSGEADIIGKLIKFFTDPYYLAWELIGDLTEDVTYKVDSEMSVSGGTGAYTAYVNATLNKSTTLQEDINSIPVSIRVIAISWEDYADDNSVSRVLGETDSKVINQNYTVDQDGDGVAETVTVGTLKTTPDLPREGEEVQLVDLEQDSIRMRFFSGNVNGTARLNRTFVLRHENSTIYERQLLDQPIQFDFEVNGTQVNTWPEGHLTYYINYYEPGTSDQLLAQEQGVRNFNVNEELGPIQSFRLFFRDLKEAIGGLIGVSPVLAGILLVLAFVVPAYITARYFLAHLPAVLISGVVYSALAYVQLAPQILNLVVVISVLVYVVGKFVDAVVGS